VALRLLQHPVTILRVDAPRPKRRVRDPLVLGETEHLLELRRYVAPLALGPWVGDVADGRDLLDQGAVADLRLSQALLCRDQVADVRCDHDDADRLAVLATRQRRGVEHQLALAPVLADRGHRPSEPRLTALHPLELDVQPGQLAGRHERAEVPAPDLLGLVAEDLPARAVDVADPPIR